MKRLLRHMLWKLIGKDYIPLNPDWDVITRGRDFGLVGNASLVSRRYLPVTYPFHIEPDWHIAYQMRGSASGQLRFALSIPDTEPFCEVEIRTTLPCTWLVERRGESLFGNGELLTTGPLPTSAAWLHGDLEFTTAAGEKLIRHTSHRVRCDAGTGAGYFHGGAYADYETDPGIAPDAILDRLARHYALEGRFLDVGCATGLVVKAAQRRGMDAEGVDFSDWAVGKANTRTGGRCRVLDMDRADATDFQPPYNIVLMHSVIEHFTKPERALRLVFDLLAPGGIVFVQTLNADSLLHRLLQNDWAGYSDYTHRSPWITARWLETAALRSGFEVVEIALNGVWNENIRDEVWRSFSELLQTHPASVLLAQEYGDITEIVLRKPKTVAMRNALDWST